MNSLTLIIIKVFVERFQVKNLYIILEKKSVSRRYILDRIMIRET